MKVKPHLNMFEPFIAPVKVTFNQSVAQARFVGATPGFGLGRGSEDFGLRVLVGYMALNEACSDPSKPSTAKPLNPKA